MQHINGYDRLSIEEMDLFDTTYKKHLSSMKLEERINYSENNIQKIEVKRIEEGVSLLKVYYKDEVFVYLPGHKWIKV